MGKNMTPERADRRRARILLAVLLLLLAANLRPSYSVTVAGEPLPGRYGRRQTERCAALARETAEEILGEEPLLPEPELQLHLSLRRADGDDAVLTDALLRAVPGVAVAEEVRVNGVRLGTVADGQQLLRALERSIRGQMPLAAVSYSISGRLELRRVYTRAGSCTPDGDMILLITGMAPVVYVDADGRLA
jgi:hypothetical protein